MYLGADVIFRQIQYKAKTYLSDVSKLQNTYKFTNDKYTYTRAYNFVIVFKHSEDTVSVETLND